jgi:hypothetical protein
LLILIHLFASFGCRARACVGAGSAILVMVNEQCEGPRGVRAGGR